MYDYSFNSEGCISEFHSGGWQLNFRSGFNDREVEDVGNHYNYWVKQWQRKIKRRLGYGQQVKILDTLVRAVIAFCKSNQSILSHIGHGKLLWKSKLLWSMDKIDNLVWSNSRVKLFTDNNCYKMLLQQNSHGTSSWTWKVIWKTKAPVRAACFGWIATREACLTLTQSNLQRRGFPLCSRCFFL